MAEQQLKSRAPEFFFISELLRDKVLLQKGDDQEVIGTLIDLEIKLGGNYPEVVNLIVGRSFGRPALEIPVRYISSIDAKRSIVSAPEGVMKEFEEESSRVLIKEMILDKKIIDTDEYEVEVVYDIHLLRTERGMFVVHVDVTKAGMFRRLHLGWLTHFRSKSSKATDLLPWKYVQPLPSDLDRFHGNVKLNISSEKIADIHPVDLADIMEELSTDERVAIMDTLDTETAADTLEEAEPRVQRDLVASLRHDRIAELFNTMTPAQIADILEILPRVDAEALRKLLPAQVEGIVHELLKFHDVELPSIATSRYLALPETATVGQALAKFRSRTQRYDVVMYVYVITQEGTLKGVVDIRELITAEPEETLGIIMTEQIVTLSRSDSLADAASEFTKYGFRALPMVDEERKLVGAVRYKDLLSVMQ